MAFFKLIEKLVLGWNPQKELIRRPFNKLKFLMKIFQFRMRKLKNFIINFQGLDILRLVK